MKRLLIPLLTTLFTVPACDAEATFKCTTEGGVTFQSMPCPAGATSAPVLPPSARAAIRAEEDKEAAPGPAAGPAPPKSAAPAPVAIQSSRNELQPGMSDLQVLNNRRWGKPQRITRSRDERAWHEHWDYKTGANGGKQLHFVNGMLAGINDLVYPAQVASMTPVVIIKIE